MFSWRIKKNIFLTLYFLLSEAMNSSKGPPLWLCMLGKNFSRQHFEIFSYFSLKIGDNLHEVSDPIFKENKKKISSVCCLLNLPTAW